MSSWENKSPVPERLLEALTAMQSLSQLDLYYQIGDNLVQLPNMIERNAKLTSLDLQIVWLGNRNWNVDMRQCQAVILSVQNLRSLRIDVRRIGRDRHLPSWSDPPVLSFTSHEQIPPIKHLFLKDLIIGLPRTDGVEHRLQLEALRVLTISVGPFVGLKSFLGALMSRGELRVVRLAIIDNRRSDLIRIPGWSAFLDRFLKSFKGLNELILIGPIASALHSIQAGIHCHGETLECLELHDPLGIQEIDASPREERTSFTDLQDLSFACPRLETLRLDIPLGIVSWFPLILKYRGLT